MTIWWWLIQHLATTTLLAALVASVCAWTTSRPALHRALWIVVLVKLMLPPLVIWPWAMPAINPIGALSFDTEQFVNRAADLSSTDESLSFMTRVALTFLANPMLWILLSAWALGALAMTMAQARRLSSQIIFLRNTTAAPEFLVVQARALSNSLGVREIPILLASNICTPFVWCLGLPRIIWPSNLASQEHARRLHGVMAHELAHIKLGDHWVAWLDLLAGIAWWWNPLFYLVRQRLREAAELACDAIAVTVVGQDRREFAQALLELSSAPEPALVLGVKTLSRRFFERRLTMLLSNDVITSLSRRAIVAIAMLACLAAPGWSLGQTQSGDAKSTATTPAVSTDAPGAVVEFYFAQTRIVTVNGKEKEVTYYLQQPPVLAHSDVADVRIGTGQDNTPQIEIVFSEAGQEKIAKATRGNIGRRLAIVVDGKTITAPIIRAEIAQRAIVTGNFSDQEMKRLVERIRPGSSNTP